MLPKKAGGTVEQQQQQAAIDSILDAALDALGDDGDEEKEILENVRRPRSIARASDETKTNNTTGTRQQNEDNHAENTKNEKHKKKRPVMGPEPPPPIPPVSDADMVDAEKMLSAFMQEMMKLEDNPKDFLSMIQDMESELQQEQKQRKQHSTNNKNKNKEFKNMTSKENTVREMHDSDANTVSLKTGASAPTKAASGGRSSEVRADNTTTEVDATISSLLHGMANSSVSLPLEQDKGVDDVGGNDEQEEEEEEILRRLLQGLESLKVDSKNMDDEPPNDDVIDTDALMDGMMEQLISKEFMYEPMKLVVLKFPEWLEKNRIIVSEQEYSQRQKQYLVFQRIVETYESEEPDKKRVVQLIQEVQEYGQPPKEIIQEIAPGLEHFDPEKVEECVIL